MGEFEYFIKAKYPVDYESLKEKYPNVPVVEFYGYEQDVWNHQQTKIEQLEKRLNAATNLLNDLKTERKDFKEFDLYDKGYRVAVDYLIQDLEKALRGES